MPFLRKFTGMRHAARTCALPGREQWRRRDTCSDERNDGILDTTAVTNSSRLLCWVGLIMIMH